MAHIMDNEELNNLLAHSWDDLCRYAYEQFLNFGRGFIGIDRTPTNDDYQLMFVRVGEGSTLDVAIKNSVAAYNPETEMVIHFACAQDQYRTVRLRSQNGRGPKSVWEERGLKPSEN
jgi:hypothetical protein